jgi:hypothetical protein
MVRGPVPYVVFISHASRDKWVAGQIAKELSAIGVDHFLDATIIETGDSIDDELKAALTGAAELLVLLTPASVERPYVWLEIGAAWIQGKRIIGILFGMTTSELAKRDGTPAFLTDVLLRDINELDEYLEELKRRLPDG